MAKKVSKKSLSKYEPVKYAFSFLDETGVLCSDPKQRFFGIGRLEILNTSEFYHELTNLYHKVLSRIEAKRREKIKQANFKNFKYLLKNNKRFEFKFNHIDEVGMEDYKNLIHLYLKHDLKFVALVIDSNKFLQKDVWQSYIKHAQEVLEIENNFKQIVIADYLDKPKRSSMHFEDVINELSFVANTCQVESDACLFIQVVDVLLGAVVYDYKIKYIFQKEDKKRPKTQIVHLLRKGLNQESLCGAELKNRFIVKEFL